jgi:iduronate 2-sulfatase
MMRNIFALALIFLPSWTVSAKQPTVAKQPNVLFIAVDDLRTALGCYGDDLVKSPNIDRLASQSRVFQRAYCQQAVCGPSRTALLTGRLPDETRVWHNRNLFRDTFPDLVTLPQLFKNNGYQALSLGKVFSGSEGEMDPVSWHSELLREPGWKNYLLRESGEDGKGNSMEAADVPDDGYADGKLAALAVKSLQQLKNSGQPFFLAVGFFKPHLPFNAPKKYWDLYSPEIFDSVAQNSPVMDAPEIAHHTHRELGGYRDMPKNERVTAEQARNLRHGYYACVSYVDAQIGKLLDTLDQLGMADNTIVVLWGDHGFALGEQQRWCKGTNFELDTRVPLMIRSPQLPMPGAATESLVEVVDIYPTLAEMAGLQPPEDLSGQSLVPILKSPAAQVRDEVLSQFARPFNQKAPEFMGYSVRTNTHRYTRWISWADRQTVSEELYDYRGTSSVQRDGAYWIEHRNIAGEPAQASTKADLSRRLDQILQQRIKKDAPASSLTTGSERQKKKQRKQSSP